MIHFLSSADINFLEKAKLFNKFFSKQCQPLQNNSTLPKSNTYHTENRLNDITFDNEKLLKITQPLYTTKGHGYDCNSTRILKLSSPTIIKPLCIIFQNCLKSEIFSDDWKKGYIVPASKKRQKYFPTSLEVRGVFLDLSKAFDKVWHEGLLY